MSSSKEEANLNLECPFCYMHFRSVFTLQLHVEDHNNDRIVGTQTTNLFNGGPTVSVLPSSDQVAIHSRGPSTSDQLSEVRRKQAEKFRRAKPPGATTETASSLPAVIDISDDDEDMAMVDAKFLMLQQDEEMARRMAREEEDYQVALQLSRAQEDQIPGNLSNGFASVGNAELLEHFDLQSVAQDGREKNTENHTDLSLPFDLSNLATQTQIFHTKYPDAEPGISVTFNLHAQIRRWSEADKDVEKLYLSYDCGHFGSDAETGGYGCGYRNCQVLISAMFNVPELRNRLVNELGGLYVPSILKIQRMIEKGRAEGWDPMAQTEGRGNLIRSKKWIGPVDLYAMFMSMGIECKIICFILERTQPPHRHPALFNWLEGRFSNSSNFPFPVYLQHQGHSQTVIGMEKRRNSQRHLLVFDPAVNKKRMTSTPNNGDRWLDDNVRRSLDRICKPKYEVMCFTGKILSQSEKNAAKMANQNGIRGERFIS